MKSFPPSPTDEGVVILEDASLFCIVIQYSVKVNAENNFPFGPLTLKEQMNPNHASKMCLPKSRAVKSCFQ